MARPSSDRLALLSAVLAEKGLAAPRATSIPRRAERERAPLSSAQERLFFLELYEPGTALYNDALAVRIEGRLDEVRLARALASVAERHETLRTSLVLTERGPEQRIHPLAEVSLALRRVELAATPDPLAAARALAREDATHPFDLERAPLWRVTLARLGPDDWALLLTMHHIVSDGASMGLFFDELTAAYDSRAARPVLRIQFGDYAAWELAQRDPRRAERDLAYWQRVLGDAVPVCVWPEGRGRAGGRGAQVPLRLDAESVARLAERARMEQATQNQVLLAAWFTLLALESGSTDLCTGIASSLRARRELEPLLGFFVQSLPMRLDLRGDPTFHEVVGRVRTAAFEAQEHGLLPFDHIARAARREGHQRLLQTFFSHMKDAIRPPAFADTRATFEFVDAGVARFELAIVLHQTAQPSSTAQGLTGFLEFDLGVFAPETAERLAGAYMGLVEAALARPELRLTELSALCAPRARGVQRRALPPLPPRPRRAAGG